MSGLALGTTIAQLITIATKPETTKPALAKFALKVMLPQKVASHSVSEIVSELQAQNANQAVQDEVLSHMPDSERAQARKMLSTKSVQLPIRGAANAWLTNPDIRGGETRVLTGVKTKAKPKPKPIPTSAVGTRGV